MAMAVVAAFTLTMLLGATAIWAAQQVGGTVNVGALLWVLFPTTLLLSSTVLEYLELGSLMRSLRASLLSTALVAAVTVALYGLWVAL
jgi:hypothetical protein